MPGGRSRKVYVALSDEEFTRIAAMAAGQNLAPGAWLGMVGLELTRSPARGEELTSGRAARTQALLEVYAALMDSRRILRNIGGNLNDVARHANSTGTLPVETRQVQAIVARRVLSMDPMLAALLESLEAAGVDVPRRPA